MKIWQKTFKFKLWKLDTAKAWVKVIVKVVQCQYELCVHKAASKNKQTLRGTKLCTAVVSQTKNRRHPNWSFENWTHWKHMSRGNCERSRIAICVHIWIDFWNTNMYGRSYQEILFGTPLHSLLNPFILSMNFIISRRWCICIIFMLLIRFAFVRCLYADLPAPHPPNTLNAEASGKSHQKNWRKKNPW